jgi:hypothetical protein
MRNITALFRQKKKVVMANTMTFYMIKDIHQFAKTHDRNDFVQNTEEAHLLWGAGRSRACSTQR